MIKVDKLSKTFGLIKAVDDVSFEVEKGDILGFLGPNGAGKSTTMKMITGFLTPDAGTVKISDNDIITDSINARKKIGYLPENVPLYEEMQVESFLRFIAEIRGLNDIDGAIKKVEESCKLYDVMFQLIGTLSKGYRRRVALAQALIHDPEVLILDEPTDGLDPNQKYHVRGLIKDLSKDKVIIISTHILEEVHAICNRTIIINHGKLLVDSTPSDLMKKEGGTLEDVFRKLTLHKNKSNGGKDE